MCISQSPFRRVSPFLLALFLVASFWVAGPALANSEGFYSSEADFLSKADTGWVKIAEGVYEKAMPNGETIRHGFGLKANQFFLESAMAKKEALLQRRSATDETSFAKMLSEIDHTINGLKASLARAAEKAASGDVSKAACFGPGVSLSAIAACTPSGGIAQSSVFFSDFGPCHTANAVVTANASPGSSQNQSGPLTCYNQWTAAASCAFGAGNCYISAFASIDFTSCELYQFREASRWCIAGDILE